MRSTLSSLLLAAPVLVGCGTYVDFTPLNQPPHALIARSPASVQVFASGPPARPHVDVAVIEAVQTHSLNEQGTGLMIERMRQQAAALGCDAIVLGGTTDHQGAQPGSGWDLLDPGSTKRQATCVVFDDPPAPRRMKKERFGDSVPSADSVIESAPPASDPARKGDWGIEPPPAPPAPDPARTGDWGIEPPARDDPEGSGPSGAGAGFHG